MRRGRPQSAAPEPAAPSTPLDELDQLAATLCSLGPRLQQTIKAMREQESSQRAAYEELIKAKDARIQQLEALVQASIEAKRNTATDFERRLSDEQQRFEEQQAALLGRAGFGASVRSGSPKKGGKQPFDFSIFDAFALRDLLKSDQLGRRVIDFFREMDADKSGELTKAEFGKAVKKMGFVTATKEKIDEVFSWADKDGGGTIEYTEMDKKLRSLRGERGSPLGAPPPPAASKPPSRKQPESAAAAPAPLLLEAPTPTTAVKGRTAAPLLATPPSVSPMRETTLTPSITPRGTQPRGGEKAFHSATGKMTPRSASPNGSAAAQALAVSKTSASPPADTPRTIFGAGARTSSPVMSARGQQQGGARSVTHPIEVVQPVGGSEAAVAVT